MDFGDGTSFHGVLDIGPMDPVVQLRFRSAIIVHEYTAAAAYLATLRLCCRPSDVENNGGAETFLQVSVIIASG